ncbi:hypothetical protein ACFWEJ_05000 [Promicromonospora sp. NPDC060204]|uniref:hypothetical protein n=1 Tax=Promicromonospora sp. NPDC060204 TaxID=3347071 RepID=UPI003662A4FF
MRWPWERSWIRRAEEVVDRELARWFDPPHDGTPVPEEGTPVRDAPDDEAEPVENPDGTGARSG